MQVSQCMSRNVEVVDPDTSLREAARTMARIDAGVLPVGENDRLVGIVSIGDLAKEEEGETGEAMREITQPGGAHAT